MRNPMSAVLVCVLFAAGAVPAAQQAPETTSSSSQKLTFDGDLALWTVAIRPDKTADFERVMNRLREALMKSDDPQRREQAKGWKVVRVEKPLPDGNIAYVHVINPVVQGADYTIMRTLYDEFPDERQQLYDLYRGAFVKNLGLGFGDIAIDMATSPAAAAQTAAVAR